MRHTGWCMGDAAVKELKSQVVLRLLRNAPSLGPVVDEARRLVTSSDQPTLRGALVPTADLLRTYSVRLKNAREEGRQVLGGESLISRLEGSGFNDLVVAGIDSGRENAILFFHPKMASLIAAVIVVRDPTAQAAVG